MPPVRLRQRTADHPAREIWPASVGLVGPGSDRFGQVDVGLGVAGHRTGHPRQRLHQVLLVDGGEHAVGRGGELAHHQPTAWPGDPGHLAQRRCVVDDIARARS